MKRIVKYSVIMLVFLIAASCIQEIRFEGEANQNVVRFVAKNYNIDLQRTKAVQDSNPTQKERYFLGMLDDDSLFFSVTESQMAPATKSTRISNSIQNFHLTAYKTEESTPYINRLRLVTEDNWASYSPLTFWPTKYTTIDFFAYSYDLGNDPISPEFNRTGGYSTRFTYTTPKDTDGNDASVQPDLMFAFAPAQSENEDNETHVELNFVRAMAGVRFLLGPMGDAQVDNLAIELNKVISQGACTITYAETGNTVAWSSDSGSRQTFTHNFSSHGEDSFMIIPQDLTGTEISFTASINIGGKIHTFEPRLLSEATAKWEEGKMYTYTITSGGYVESTITEQSTSTKFKDFRIQNTGWTTSFVRAALMGYWYITETRTENGATTTTEKIVATWKPDDTTTGNFSKSPDWDSYWEKGADGLYYYKFSLLPGTSTWVPLFDEYELTKEAPIDGAKLRISVAVQAVQYNIANSVWPSTHINKND